VILKAPLRDLSRARIAARVYHFVGQDRRLPEPEKTVMFAIGIPEALITVEVISPTSKLDLTRVMQTISGATSKWPARSMMVTHSC
jgi:hypothetical protein